LNRLGQEKKLWFRNPAINYYYYYYYCRRYGSRRLVGNETIDYPLFSKNSSVDKNNIEGGGDDEAAGDDDGTQSGEEVRVFSSVAVSKQTPFRRKKKDDQPVMEGQTEEEVSF
jgi:hypothetical protein